MYKESQKDVIDEDSKIKRTVQNIKIAVENSIVIYPSKYLDGRVRVNVTNFIEILKEFLLSKLIEDRKFLLEENESLKTRVK